ncbi:response regulator transcription factor [Endothiovibrio diazotrophicus]
MSAASAARILVIDDDRAAVRLLVDRLRGRGYRLLIALDAVDGHHKALTLAPDLILLDVRMPQVDGHALCRLLKDDPRTRDIPVIFVTALADPRDKLEGFGAGGCDYVTKPYDLDELAARIRVHLGLRGRLREGGAEVGEGGATPVAPTPPHGRDDHALTEAALAILREELAAPPTLVALAHRVGTNERRLTEAFRHRFGVPVFAFLREERFRQACAWLVESDLAVGEIAIQLGYSSAAAFSAGFRERYGISPREYRRSAGLAAIGEAPAGET